MIKTNNPQLPSSPLTSYDLPFSSEAIGGGCVPITHSDYDRRRLVSPSMAARSPSSSSSIAKR